VGDRPQARLGEGTLVAVDQVYAKSAPRPVKLGARPESIRLAVPGEPSAVTATVDLIELTGPEKIVSATLGPDRFTARLDANTRLAKGDVRQFVFESSAVRLFDPATGVAL